jgi:hypothetical protein
MTQAVERGGSEHSTIAVPGLRVSSSKCPSPTNKNNMFVESGSCEAVSKELNPEISSHLKPQTLNHSHAEWQMDYLPSVDNVGIFPVLITLIFPIDPS